MAGNRHEALDRPTRRLSYLLQAALAYPFFWLVGLLPKHAGSDIGGWIGRRLGPRIGITKRARNNLGRILPDLSAAERETIVADMWDNLGRTLFEYPQLHGFSFGEPGSGADIEVVGWERVDQLKNDGMPGIFFAGHFANWELAAMSVFRRGLDIRLIYRAPNNPYLDRLFRHRHVDPDLMMPKGTEGARAAVKTLRSGGHLGILGDQKMNDGIAVPFMGTPAMTAPALALFALKFDTPVVPVWVERIKGTKFRVTFYDPIAIEKTDDQKADIQRIMTEVNAWYERWIRERPAQWLWLHNRWPKA